ncbi:hypothetical protein FNV43_RR06273 [Rhamnella rubrinervis]|uniref:Uncharacterized protein n=1 Tax=Rhamnella rubrinervis TaxID=2594499 RepID=A0A8K0HE97_9ROSA|nr:hypothetical protein FNV43_RR06273 [Rhamnella rubrinervis]
MVSLATMAKTPSGVGSIIPTVEIFYKSHTSKIHGMAGPAPRPIAPMPIESPGPDFNMDVRASNTDLIGQEQSLHMGLNRVDGKHSHVLDWRRWNQQP